MKHLQMSDSEEFVQYPGAVRQKVVKNTILFLLETQLNLVFLQSDIVTSK